MPPRKKKAAAVATARPRRSTRQVKSTDNGAPNVYEDMLAEVARNSEHDPILNLRPTKRRKITPIEQQDVDDLFESAPPSPVTSEAQGIDESVQPTDRPQQTIYDDFEDSEESDAEFEDVDLDVAAQSDSDKEQTTKQPLQIDLTKSALETPQKTIQRRKPLSKAERMARVDVHKWHLLSLTGHGLHRNAWCNNETVHSILKPLVPRKTIKLFHVEESEPMYQRNHSFNKAVEEICAIWRREWNINTCGMRRSRWREDVDARDEIDRGEDLDFEDFQDAAHTRRGSRDLGAQLFTALLRSVAVEARLVFSLQVLPFAGTVKFDTPSKPEKNTQYIRAPAQNYGSTSTPSSRPKKQPKIIDSPYPIFWTEILTPTQSWIPLDPLVRNTIAKPKTQFEPPLSDTLNSMTYVIAYEDNNTFRDVTRRYTQWFNAKTRRLRVESTKAGEAWYTSILSNFAKKLREPRDEVEDDELARKGNSEGMPQNVQDFKNHPVYVLERHLRRNEVLQPKREVGKMNVGTAKNGKIEPVYRRQDVHLCRSADAWYRRGRDVRMGEQPLKVIQSKSRKLGATQGYDGEDEEDEAETEGIGLYAEYQTDIYEPPPVKNGMIPKNAYGNLDVYVPSMIPAGAVHVSHRLAASAARILHIDYTDAVVGFDFKGRQGTAVVDGIVVAEPFTAAIATTINSLEALGSEEIQHARSKIILDVWKRMLQALRVRERVDAEYGSTETRNNGTPRADDTDHDEEGSSYDNDETDEKAGGGFMPDDEPTEEKTQEQAINMQALKAKMPTILPDEIISVTIKITRSPHKLPSPAHVSKPSLLKNDTIDSLFDDHDAPNNDDTDGGGFLPEHTNNPDLDGGFMIPGHDEGGGFIPSATNSPPANHSVSNPHHEPDDKALQLAIANSLLDHRSPPIPNHPELTPSNDPEAKVHLPLQSPSQSRSRSRSQSQSLLSHDPDESNEEPEWINDALD